MTHLLQKINKRKLAAVLVLLVVLALSMTVVQKAASDPENHTGTIEALDEKKADVLKLTASSAAAATARAASPGDATTPVANKLADLTSYFLIVLMVVFLEKYLVRLRHIFHPDPAGLRPAWHRDLCGTPLLKGAGRKSGGLRAGALPDHPHQHACVRHDRGHL